MHTEVKPFQITYNYITINNHLLYIWLFVLYVQLDGTNILQLMDYTGCVQRYIC